MRAIFLFFLFLSTLAHAEWDHLFSDDEDPSLFHHVNVITGNLNLCLQDGVVQGAKPLPLFRTYSSSGALERTTDVDWKLRDLRGFLVQGGWSFFPHMNLWVEIDGQLRKTKAFLPEKSGNLLTYSYAHEKDGGGRYFRPKFTGGQCSGSLSARTDPRNNYLRLNTEKGRATLFLPDGGSRDYVGEKRKYYKGQKELFYYRLESENLPSGHKIHYRYSHRDSIKEISITNPSESKTLASILFSFEETDVPFRFQIITSDKKQFDFASLAFKKRDYLNSVTSNARPHEICHYAPGRKGTGARIESLERDGKLQFKAHYYLPPNHKAEVKWDENPDKKDFSADKVSRLEAPIGTNGEMLTLGQFSYCKEFTDVRDSEGILTRYHHDGEKLTKIEYFDEKGRVYSGIKFLWDGEKLRCKMKVNARDEPIYAKTFHFDAAGNVDEEVLWGNLTGQAKGPFCLKENYTLSGAESLYKRFSYDQHFNTPLEEEEENGFTTRFFYKPGTDLLTLKLISDKERILKREIFEYDTDHLLIAEIVDDGCSSNPLDLSGITMRKITRYTLDPGSGLTKAASEFYYDTESRSETLLKRVELSHSHENLVKSEAVYDASNTYRYTLLTDYEKGRIIRRTTPLGHANTYRYDSLGNLLECKEVGSPHKTFHYDGGGRPQICVERDAFGNENTRTSLYDPKGRLLTQIDKRGNATEQKYDAFGRCTLTEFPQTYDEAGKSYTPTAYFTYDVQGNLTSSTNTNEETTETDYNTLRKPIEIRYADGTCIRHLYNKNGTLSKTIYPDETEVHYTYDLFQRMTSKTLLTKSGTILSKESWEYTAFHLLSHTDPRDLTTRYTYDGAGRKIYEQAEERKKSFSYDALGFLERTIEGDVAHVQVCDLEGRVVEEWIEETSGRTENWMRFFYNEEGKKEKAIRFTSQGEAVDLFFYDGEGRLIKHIDPEEHVTQYLFRDDEKNALGQRVQQKSTIDALGNVSIGTHDALNRLVMLEKKDSRGHIVSREEHVYDRSGNRTKRITSVFQKSHLVKKISALWEYDSMGRVIREIEDEKKITILTYDERGRVKTRTLPDGKILSHAYDGASRLTELKSSDKTIHLHYFYEWGGEPTEIHDLIQNRKLVRKYNLFGELIEEINPLGLHYEWERDDKGRVTRFTLPDGSSIANAYAGNHLISVERKTANDSPLYAHHYTKFDVNGHVHEETLIHRTCAIRTTRDLLERPIAFNSPPLQHQAAYGPTSLVMATKNSLFGEKKYAYDALNQLAQEGTQSYDFDSIGNPSQCETGSCNQISSFEGCTLHYDENGNPLQRVRADEQTLYTYDALGRLTSITYPHKKQICYLYDPFSRLLAKEVAHYKNGLWKKAPPLYYLYDQEKEIGTFDPQTGIRELKVLGLGVRGEIGAAVAIEIGGKAYAPLHDFQGNILALISAHGEIIESYQMSAFGKEKIEASPLNPWRFSSKRTEEGLIFFGKRFYDPSLGRWLTPDPSGFADGPNLYIFVLNSPLNRLDLFGLVSEPQFTDMRMDFHLVDLTPLPSNTNLLHLKGRIRGVPVDWVVRIPNLQQLQFTPEERNAGIANVFDHFHECLQKEGAAIGLITLQNGILTSLPKFTAQCQSLVDKIPEGTPFIGLHNPTKGGFADFWRAAKEICGKETSIVCATRQFLNCCSETLHKYNPELLMLHIAHSEGGAIAKQAIAGMTPEQQARMQKSLCYFGVAPALPLPKSFGFDTLNIYSEEDFVTGKFGAFREHSSEYNIQFVPCRSSQEEKSWGFADHGWFGGTYQHYQNEQMKYYRKNYGFSNENIR